MSETIDPTEMTEEEIEEKADEVKRQQDREKSKYGGKLEGSSLDADE